MVTPALIVIENDCSDAVVPVLSLTVTANENFPVVVLIPPMMPVEGLSVRPSGSAPELRRQLM
jgi:hypothetical protein